MAKSKAKDKEQSGGELSTAATPEPKPVAPSSQIGLKELAQEFEPECDIASLKPHPQNPNMASEKPVLSAINELGFYGAVVAQKQTRYILVGNTRWKAKKNRGDKTIPVLWVEVDSVSAVRIMLADNRTADLATYNEAELTAVLSEVQQLVGPEALKAIGFSEPSLSQNPEATLKKVYRPSIKTKIGASALRVNKVTIGIGILRFGIAADTFRAFYEALEEESKASGISIEEICAQRLGVPICQ